MEVTDFLSWAQELREDVKQGCHSPVAGVQRRSAP